MRNIYIGVILKNNPYLVIFNIYTTICSIKITKCLNITYELDIVYSTTENHNIL